MERMEDVMPDGLVVLVPAPFLKHLKGIRDVVEWYRFRHPKPHPLFLGHYPQRAGADASTQKGGDVRCSAGV
jgi:hypothetical protein